MANPSSSEVFRRLFDEHHRQVQAYCWRRLPATLADDAVAEVFLTAWRRIGDVPEGEETLPWLFGVARNVVRNATRALNRTRRLDARVSAMPVASADGPAVAVIRSEDHRRRLAVFNRLKRSEREVLLLQVWEGLSVSEVAQVLGITAKAAEGRLRRARRKLQARLTADAGGRPLHGRGAHGE